jgi:uncharacterized protein YegL
VNKNKKPKTLVTFLLDMSGSMLQNRGTTLCAVNEYIDSLREQKRTRFTLTLFNSAGITTVCSDVKLKQVEELTYETYQPDSLTPLYDTIARVIKEVKKDFYDRVLCVILTDGLENDSKEYSHGSIVSLIKQKETDGWSFVYLGSNQDAWAVGRSLGFSGANTLTYESGKEGAAIRLLKIGTQSYLTDETTVSRAFFRDDDEDSVTQTGQGS